VTPLWLDVMAWHELHPPAEILLLGELPRAPEKLLGATRALCVMTAERYRPTVNGTLCNIFASDAFQILRAPLPHIADPADGFGRRELNVNDTFAGLHAGQFPGWSLTGTIASASAVIALAAEGRPQFAIWRNPKPLLDQVTGKPLLDGFGRPRNHSGHISVVVPTPAGATGIYVTSAGARCVQECPIAQSFGPYVHDLEIWTYSK
jgi:hypothetical protein